MREDDAPRIEEILEALRSQRDEIARVNALLVELVDSRQLADRQMERILVLQQRTNALVELLLGSAFDVELGEPRRA